MSVDMEMLEAIGQLMDKKLEPINKRLDGIENNVGILTKRMDFMEESVTWMRGVMVRLENEEFPKIDIALDKLCGHDERLTSVEIDVERHDVQIVALQRA
jgi:hypothetical protein